MGDGIKTELNALRSDAKTWESAAGDLDGPRNTVRSLKIDPAHVSMYGVDKGIDRTYEEARAAIEDMLKKATEYFEKLGSDLRGAANQYESDDKKGMHGLEQSAN